MKDLNFYASNIFALVVAKATESLTGSAETMSREITVDGLKLYKARFKNNSFDVPTNPPIREGNGGSRNLPKHGPRQDWMP